jgi:hypothetical protein
MPETTGQTNSVYDPDSEKPVTQPNLPAIRAGENPQTSSTGSRGGGSSSSTGSRSGGSTSGTSAGTPGGSSTGTNMGSGGSTSSTSNTPSKTNLRNAEEAPDSDSEDENDDKLGKGFTPSPHSNSTTKEKTRFKITRRRAAAGGGATGVLIAMIIGGASILQGPLEIIHFAQLLQKFHLSRNEDFGDGRGAKLMLYAMAGSAERGRLGAIGNKFADKWEARMIKKTGLRPLFNSKTGRLAGYEIISNKKDPFDALNEVLNKNPGLRTSFDRLAKNGGEVLSRNAALEKGPLRGTARKGSSPSISEKHFVLDFRDTNERGFREARVFTRAASNTVVGSKIAGRVGSRVLIKRGGVSFHLLNDQKKKVDQKADARTRKQQSDDYEKNVVKRWTENIKTGTIKGEGKNKEAKDLVEKTNAETEGKSKAKAKVLKSAAVKAAGPTAALGVLCGVKSLGDQAANVKYANTVLQEMRIGMGIVSMGNQAMSGQKINMDELSAIKKQLYDAETKTSWTQARSIQAELGQAQSGPDVPVEAKLDKVSDKGDFFQAVDYITGLPPGPVNIGTGCSLIETVSNLPIISTFSSVVQGAINTGLGLVGTSTDDLIGSLIDVINGTGVNPLPRGAELGNLANLGVFMAGNDQAIATGGTDLSETEVAQLNDRQAHLDKEEQAQKPLLARYFDPYDRASLTGEFIDNAPTSTSQIASLISPVKAMSSSFSSLLSSFMPRAHAVQAYNYGVKTYGFSLADQNNSMFEDPYENATWVEGHDLPALNSKYGKCFGMTVDENGILQNDKAVNVFKLEGDAEYKDCRDDKNTETFKRYRFYIADTVTLKSLNCYEGDEEACTEVGASGSAAPSIDAGATATTTTTGTSIDLANVREPSANIECAQGTKDLGIKDGYTQGKLVKIRLCEVSNIAQSSGYGSSNGKASVNSRVSGAFYAMAKAAAKDGVDVSALSSFRLMSEQETLCNGNAKCRAGNYELVAKPGTSNHQLGAAIDFSHGGKGGVSDNCINVGGKCTLKGEKTWEWLNTNASKFDLKQYTREFWHWSPLEN